MPSMFHHAPHTNGCCPRYILSLCAKGPVAKVRERPFRSIPDISIIKFIISRLANMQFPGI